MSCLKPYTVNLGHKKRLVPSVYGNTRNCLSFCHAYKTLKIIPWGGGVGWGGIILKCKI